jgi:DNA phosphorothioation-dependent restriction protein DptH
MNDHHLKIIFQAFTEILGPSFTGALAYCCFFETHFITSICKVDGIDLGGWKLYGVGDCGDIRGAVISTDQAVEMRENKNEPTILIVDRKSAGAGMDSIYSAGREIKESVFYKKAHEIARKSLERGSLTVAKKAVEKARKLAGRKHISPFEIFNFYIKCSELKSVGAALGHLGLWPVRHDGKLEENELDKSAKMVEKLFLSSTTNIPARNLYNELLLNDVNERQEFDLLDLLSRSSAKPWRESAKTLTASPHLWLNQLNPGIFDLENLQKIQIVPWRSVNKKTAAWSGLTQLQDGEMLEFVIDRNATKKSRSSKIEIRWQTSPETLAKGSCEYTIEVVSGGETLAAKRIGHSVTNPQKITFTTDDFENVDDDSKFEARVRVRAIGDREIEAETEDFVLRCGTAEEKAVSSSANEFRSLIEAAILIDSREDFEKIMREHDNSQHYGHDKKGYITIRCKPKSGKVLCPPLVTTIEKDWAKRDGAVGRWRIKIRSDGERVGEPEFIEIFGDCSSNTWSKVCQTSRKVCKTLSSGKGMLGVIYGPDKGFEEYINSWLEVTEKCQPSVALAGTIEIQSINNQTLGLIVLPIHPVRMAWHMGYDMLLRYARYDLRMSASEIREVIKMVDGTHFPAFLPGTEPGKSFIFGDVLNFYFVAMVSGDDREPKASVAIMARALADGKQYVGQSVAKATAASLSGEVIRYAHLHPKYDTLHIHAFHPGDSMILGRALGKALETFENDPDDDDELERPRDIGFVLKLFPFNDNNSIVGKFFSSVVESSRTGVAAGAREDRWITENRHSIAGTRRPKLVWAKRNGSVPCSTAHLAIAFDTFDSSVKTVSESELELQDDPLEVYGLVLNRKRLFQSRPEPNWRTLVGLDVDGEKHPVTRTLTDRLLKVHRYILRLTAANLSDDFESWPFLSAAVTPDKEESVARLHSLCDWVVTIDRNAGIEYFDSPKEKSNVYDAYIIECVPERDDMGFLQLVTSTSNFEEISVLLDEALATMGVSSSPRNCVFLMNQLKSLSGRFAMRLAAGGNVAQEMVAIAYTNAKCLENMEDGVIWPSLKKGFFIPIDDVPQLLGQQLDSFSTDKTRSDLLYVTVSSRGGFLFNFIEIKYRRYLRTARSNEIIREIYNQLRVSRIRWNEMYGDTLPEFTKAINRSNLARILTFYAEKGLRHNLDQEAYDRISREIKKMLREGSKYLLQKNEEVFDQDRGYIFCPEYLAVNVSNVSTSEEKKIWLFGPNSIPPVPSYIPFDQTDDSNEKYQLVPTANTNIGNLDERKEPKKLPSQNSKKQSDVNTKVILGHSDFKEDKVSWNISIRSNPHLMIVGLPGMGKTTCLLNLCLQMIEANIHPVIFSYHEDIDEMLLKRLGGNINFVDYAGLGFNPLEVIGNTAHAYVDNVSMIRDVFRAIFPDLGDIQLGSLRECLKKSYTDVGWAEYDGKSNRPPLPKFQAFYDNLLCSEKKEAGLITRLSELNDYDFFNNISGANSLLDVQKTSVIRIHQTQNETLQSAFSTFILFNLYQRMFQRGPTSRITHAIIFDEAHRAAKLKLIPRMIKECRKFGIAFVMASQEAKDFDQSVFSAIANYLVLRVSENDSKLMSKVIAPSEQVSSVKDHLKRLPKYSAFFTQEGFNRPALLTLKNI